MASSTPTPGVARTTRTSPDDGGFLYALKDNDGDGKADVVERFGGTTKTGSAGGTGLEIHDGKLYAEMDDKIVRFTLPTDRIAPMGDPEVIVSGIPSTGDHPMHPFTIGKDGGLYIGVGSATNSCQPKNRMTGIKGADPWRRTGDARRRLALRRQQGGPDLLAEGALRDGTEKRRRPLVRC